MLAKLRSFQCSLVALLVVSLVATACSPAPALPAAPAKPADPTAAPAAKPAATAAPKPAESKPAEKPAEAAKPAAKPAAPSGKITVGIAQDVLTLDGNNVAFTAEQAMLGNNLYESLVRIQPDGSIGPGLAESWRAISSTEWEFKLKAGVKFHNGEPFNAEVVKFNLERYKEPNKGRNPRIGPATAAINVVDETTVRVVTPKPDPLILETLRGALYVPMKYAQEAGDEGLAAKPVGTGPFKFVEWVKNDHLTMEANPDYWGGPPKVQTLTFRIIPEIATRVAALKAGEVEFITQLTPDQIPSLKESPTLDALSVPAPRVAQVGFNVNNPKGAPLKDVRVRQALSYAINAQAIIDTIIGGQGKRVATLAPPQAYGYDPSVQPYPYDPEKARQLLAEAGHPNGFEIDFAVPTGGALLKPLEVGQAVAADWAKVGVKANIRSLETGAWVKERDEKTISAAFLWNWVAFDIDRMIWANMHSKSPWSYNPVPGDEIEQLIDEEQSTVDEPKRKQALSRLQHILRDQAATIILYQQNDVYGISKRLKDLDVRPSGELHFWKAWVEG